MKKYTFNYNGTFGKGRNTIRANNKKDAIEKAKKLFPFLSICVSSFRVSKNDAGER